jgi:hypothetical protein
MIPGTGNGWHPVPISPQTLRGFVIFLSLSEKVIGYYTLLNRPRLSDTSGSHGGENEEVLARRYITLKMQYSFLKRRSTSKALYSRRLSYSDHYYIFLNPYLLRINRDNNSK